LGVRGKWRLEEEKKENGEAASMDQGMYSRRPSDIIY
jgi:hypothetical protein